MTTPRELLDALSTKRRNSGKTLADLAIETGLSIQRLSALENHAPDTRLSTALKLAQALGMVFELNEQMTPRRVVEAIAERIKALNPEPLRIILFGSYARGGANRNSDLDLAVVYSDAAFSEGACAAVRRAAVNRWLAVDCVFFRHSDFEALKSVPSAFAYRIAKEGMVLNERT